MCLGYRTKSDWGEKEEEFFKGDRYKTVYIDECAILSLHASTVSSVENL